MRIVATLKENRLMLLHIYFGFKIHEVVSFYELYIVYAFTDL
jgi:hypothetical protein